MIVRVAMVKSSYQMLLQEDEYNKTEKRKNKAVNAASGGYWCFAVAVYLAWSFITDDWKSTWIMWPVAGVLFAPFIAIAKQLCARKEDR